MESRRNAIMTNHQRSGFATRWLRALSGAFIALGVLLAMLAGECRNAAAQATEATYTKPKNTVEFGIGVVSDSSFKFGEYNGLQNSGPFELSKFDLRGGAPYDSGSTLRWHFYGNDLGLETRNVLGDF